MAGDNGNRKYPKHHYNEMKYLILSLLRSSNKDYSPREIADAVGTTLDGAKQRLRLLNMLGYIWRKEETRKGRKNYFSYKNLKPKGERVFLRLDERVKIREVTGIDISLNLNKHIPDYAVIEYRKTKGKK
jgi:predicted transcriptional regulator